MGLSMQCSHFDHYVKTNHMNCVGSMQWLQTSLFPGNYHYVPVNSSMVYISYVCQLLCSDTKKSFS